MPEPAIAGYHSFVRIGRGGLGDVYRAVETATGATVAVKVLRDVSDSSLAWHRTRRELTALVALMGHRHVIGPIELIDHVDGPALVMEYAAGGSVASAVTVSGTTGKWYEFDVTSYVKQRLAAGATTVSFALLAPTAGEGWAGFDSDEVTTATRPEFAAV